MQVNDDMVRAAADKIAEMLRSRTEKLAIEDIARESLTAALAHMWRPIEEAPEGPSLFGYLNQFGKWHQAIFETPFLPRNYGYTHYANLLPAPPKTGGE